MGTGEKIVTNTEEAVEIIPRDGMVGIVQFKDLVRQYSYLQGNQTVPDFALIPHTIENGLSHKKLWNKVLQIAGEIVATVPNLKLIEEADITPPRISIHSAITDPLAEVEPEANYFETVYQNFANSNLMPLISD